MTFLEIGLITTIIGIFAAIVVVIVCENEDV
jgi:biopolymer transport protein ExbB/TolQ